MLRRALIWRGGGRGGGRDDARELSHVRANHTCRAIFAGERVHALERRAKLMALVARLRNDRCFLPRTPPHRLVRVTQTRIA